MTTFFLYYHGISETMLQNYVLPKYHHNILPFPEWKTEQPGALILEFDFDRQSLENVAEIIPCCSALNSNEYAFQFSIKGSSEDGEQSSWVYLSPIGIENLQKMPGESAANECFRGEPESSDFSERTRILPNIDLFAVKTPLMSATIKVTLISSEPEKLKQCPCLISFAFAGDHHARENTHIPSFYHEPPSFLDISIPLKSQRVEDAAIQNKICSPTCVSMLLDYWGHHTTIAEVAEKVYNIQHGIYGIWPANIRAASQWGISGYLLRFTSLEELSWFLKQGIPIVASVNYTKGELRQAAIEETQGHLLVIRGLKEDKVLVNDPASYDVHQVYREYRAQEFETVWLKRKGVGYVLFPYEVVDISS